MMRKLKILAWLLALLLILEAGYCVAIFTDWVPALSRLRQMYIETAMSTMTKQWLATALIPGDVVQEAMDKVRDAQQSQVGQNSQWEDAPTTPSTQPKDPEAWFFDRFYELEAATVRDYVGSHPEAIADGWDNFYVNQSGLDQDGTSMQTVYGDQVLAVDAANGLLVVRVTGSTYRGVLILGKDPSRLKCAASSQWGVTGEQIGVIAENNNGLAAITGSGYEDNENTVPGAVQVGSAMCSGVELGIHAEWGHKRIELRSDDRLYIVDSTDPYSPDCTDATEWTPALVVNGVNVAGEDKVYVSLNPRACLGQTRDGSILMLGIEGRSMESLGCNAYECAELLLRYGAYQAMNLDGGTSAMVWYQGQYILKCSDITLPQGRMMPNAWVYCGLRPNS